MTNYLEELNESQRNAVLYNDGPSLVIAGAGSGKTRVLTYKIAYLLEQGYQPWSILALTFTNKAAREMKERIARRVGEEARYLWMGTFHSIFSRILRSEAHVIGFTSNFTIYDSSDSKSLIKSIVKEMHLDDKTYKPGMIQSRISNAKNHLVLPDAYASNADLYQNDVNAKVPATRDIYHRYWERCRQSDAMDFDDLLVYTYLLFRDHPEIRQKYAGQFRYVLVDEYQDTNFAQHSIVLQLTKEHQHVCVVGDDAQSIYSFRGANIDNILKFTQLYKGAKLFKLEQNYRSTQTIVCAANSLIEKNSEQIRKEVFSEKAKGEPIGVFNAICWTYGYNMMSGGAKMNLRTVLLNPGMIGLLFGLPIYFFKLQLPALLTEPVGFLSNLNTPLAMLVIGSYIARVDLHSFISDLAVYKMAALRLVAAPAAYLAVLLLIRPEPDLLVSSVIQAAAPVAANTVLFAVEYHQDSELASKTVAVSTVLSIITIPIFTILAQLACQFLF